MTVIHKPGKQYININGLLRLKIINKISPPEPEDITAEKILKNLRVQSYVIIMI
jgi:hypothetical protein